MVIENESAGNDKIKNKVVATGLALDRVRWQANLFEGLVLKAETPTRRR